MEDNNLYTSHNLAISIKGIAKQRNIVIKDMLNDCDLGSNTMSSLYHGKPNQRPRHCKPFSRPDR